MRSRATTALAVLAVVMAACDGEPEPGVDGDSVAVLDREAGAQDDFPLEELEDQGITSIDEDGAETARLARSTDAYDYYVLEQPGSGICLATTSREAEPMLVCGGRLGSDEDGVLVKGQGPHGTAGIAVDDVENVDSMAVENNVFLDESARP